MPRGKEKDQERKHSHQMGYGNLDCETIKDILRMNQEKVGMDWFLDAIKELMLILLGYGIVIMQVYVLVSLGYNL